MSSWLSGSPSKSSGRSAGNFTAPDERLREPNSTARSPSTRNSPSVISAVISGDLDDHRGTHAAAGAHRQNADTSTAPAQFVDRRGDHPGTGRRDRVAEADTRPVDVDDLLVEPEFAGTRHRLGRERLVDLKQRHVLELAAGQLERLRDGLDRPTTGPRRVQSDLRPGQHA